MDGGTEIVLKLRLSSTCMDVKLPVSTKDTIGMAKKKLQVSTSNRTKQKYISEKSKLKTQECILLCVIKISVFV